jgi:hypothetical protein
MDNNKSFFYYAGEAGTVTTGVGVVNSNLDLRRILGQKYDKFDAFNITMESYIQSGGVGEGTDSGVSCIHISGFPFMNNYYDTLNDYSNSRVIELFASAITENIPSEQGVNYQFQTLQNIHKVSFYKPNTPIINTLITFITSTSGTFYTRPNNGTNHFSCIFAITGIDAYRVRRIERPFPVYRSYTKPNPMLVLNSAYATSLDPIDPTFTKKRLFRFDNINWRQIIGNELYDKYDKFALVTRRFTLNPTTSSFASATNSNTLFLSGSNLVFENRTDSQFVPVRTNVAVNNAIQFHSGVPVCIGLVRTFAGSRGMRDVYTENIFYKPTQDIGFITVNYSMTFFLNIASYASNNNTFPTLILHFEIIPVVDVK